MDRLRLLINALRMLARQPSTDDLRLLTAERAIGEYLGTLEAPQGNPNLSACARPSVRRPSQAKVAFGLGGGGVHRLPTA
jgi:hypothetical protein